MQGGRSNLIDRMLRLCRREPLNIKTELINAFQSAAL